MRLTIGIIAAHLAVALLALPANAADAEKVQRFRGPIDQADVVGGYASDRVIVRVVAEIEPARTADNRLTFSRTGRDVLNAADLQLAATLERWQVDDIRPTLPFAPANEQLAQQFGLDRYYTIIVPAGTPTREMVGELSRFEHFEVAEVDGIGGILQTVPNDPSFNLQYGLHNTGQTIQGQPGIAGADISAVEAWDLHTGSPDIIIAVVDTGIAVNHPDFAGKLVTGYNSMDGSSNVGDSFIIPHGTHVSGIAAAATNNGTGIAGVSWGSRIMPIKALNLFGGGSETDIANGCIWAADNGAHVINMSLGVPDGITYFENAVNYAHAQGVLVIAASGNTPGAAIPPPARWANVMAVGATDNRDQLASFTTTGPEMSVTAPGVDVYSTYMGLFGGSTYAYQSGTSMAAPHVAGLASLVFSAGPSLTNEDVRAIIESSADDKGTPGWNQQFGFGRINAFAALQGIQPVANDFCENASIVTDGQIAFSNIGATTTGPDEPDACDLFNDSNIQSDIWFEYEATCTGTLTISLCGSQYNTKLGVYGATCPVGSGEILACDAISCPSELRSMVTLTASEGDIFKIRVGGHMGAQGDGVLTIDCEPGVVCLGDLTGDGVVDVSDLLILLGAWGTCADPSDCPADLNEDGVVDVSDLLILLGAWGPC